MAQGTTQWTSTSSLVPHLTHCPSSRSKTALLRFAGITGSPALVISSNHLGMTFKPLSKIVSGILLAPVLPAQCIRFPRLQVLPVPLEDTLEVRDELLLETRRHPVDTVHGPFLYTGDITPFLREILPDCVLVGVDQLAFEGLRVQGIHFLFVAHALREPGLDALDQWPADRLGLLGQHGLQRVIQDDDILELKADSHAVQARRLGEGLLVQRLLRLLDQADGLVEIGLFPLGRIVAEEAADEVDLLVGVPHLESNGRAQPMAVRAALAPFRLAKGNPIRHERIG